MDGDATMDQRPAYVPSFLIERSDTGDGRLGRRNGRVSGATHRIGALVARKDRQNRVADELQYLATVGDDGLSHAVETIVQD